MTKESRNLPRLPPEVRGRVISFLYKPLPPAGTKTTWKALCQKDLVAMMKVNSSMYAYAAPALYSTVVVQDMSLLLYILEDKPRPAVTEPNETQINPSNDLSAPSADSQPSGLLVRTSEDDDDTTSNSARIKTGRLIRKADLLGKVTTLHIIYHLASRHHRPKQTDMLLFRPGPEMEDSQNTEPIARDCRSAWYMARYRKRACALLRNVDKLGLGTWDDGRWDVYGQCKSWANSATRHLFLHTCETFFRLLRPRHICCSAKYGPLAQWNCHAMDFETEPTLSSSRHWPIVTGLSDSMVTGCGLAGYLPHNFPKFCKRLGVYVRRDDADLLRVFLPHVMVLDIQSTLRQSILHEFVSEILHHDLEGSDALRQFSSQFTRTCRLELYYPMSRHTGIECPSREQRRAFDACFKQLNDTIHEWMVKNTPFSTRKHPNGLLTTYRPGNVRILPLWGEPNCEVCGTTE